MDKFTAQEIIFGAIAEVNATRAHERPGTPLIPLLETTVLSGENPAVDSLELITILTGVEESLADTPAIVNCSNCGEAMPCSCG